MDFTTWIAWTSFDKSAKTFYYSPMQDPDKRIHTTQKPVALYDWILSKYAKPGCKILDTHVGSVSSLIACERLGFSYVGFELDEYYYRLAKERLKKEKAQISVFDLGLERIQKGAIPYSEQMELEFEEK